jgi:hypothetical protein
MTGGLMQLVAYGAQDVYLTGNPQITFFKMVYRRHTNFSIETIENSMNGTIGFGNRLNVTFNRNGDLINRMYLKITVNAVDPNGHKFAWVRRLGHAIINEVRVVVGGTVMDRHYGTWLDIWYELARAGDHERGYAHMIGDIHSLTNYDDTIKQEYTMYIPLQFWFNRYVGLAIPMIAFQYHNVVIEAIISPLENLIVRDCNFDITTVTLKNVSILTDYVYLDSEERRRFAITGHEYLIEQLQFSGVEPVQFDVQRYKLDFNHPVKELFWAMKHGNYTNSKSFVHYTNNDVWNPVDAACNIVINSISIGSDPSPQVGGAWFQVQTQINATVGTFNIKNLSAQSVWINPTSLTIGENYGITSKIAADVTINVDNTIDCQNVETTLSVRDISFPIDFMVDTRVNTCDPMINMFHNYGILIDGSVNPVYFALLQLNGHDRFDRREGAFFNYLQPDQHHSNNPRDGINIYSFSLYPEQHQPSGTANLSRIDSTDLQIWFMDQSKITSDEPDLNFLSDENELFIFALNYNIMRVLAGLAGLAYTSQ